MPFFHSVLFVSFFFAPHLHISPRSAPSESKLTTKSLRKTHLSTQSIHKKVLEGHEPSRLRFKPMKQNSFPNQKIHKKYDKEKGSKSVLRHDELMTSKPMKKMDSLSFWPHQIADSVKATMLDNDLLAWCLFRPEWKVIKLKVFVLGGSLSDPPKLHGRTRVLSYLLRERLNEPKNPSVSSLPPGGSRFFVTLRKNAIEIDVNLKANKFAEAFAHLATALKQPPPSRISNRIKNELLNSSSTFPPPSISERIDELLYADPSKRALLRGQKRTYEQIRPFALQSAHRQLFLSSNIRILVIGGQPCSPFEQKLKEQFGVFPSSKRHAKAKEKKDKEMSLVRPGGSPSQHMRMFMPRTMISLYEIPSLTRREYIPLRFIYDVAKKELKRSISNNFGREIPVESHLNLFRDSGYILFGLPSHPSKRKKLSDISYGAVGRLLMDPYSPELEGRLKTYIHEFLMANELSKTSILAQLDWLGPQLLLSDREPTPYTLDPKILSLDARSFRKMARRYLIKSPSFLTQPEPFTLKRIAMIVVSLFLLWIFLDLLFRRQRQIDE